jgi:hypothetical protein
MSFCFFQVPIYADFLPDFPSSAPLHSAASVRRWFGCKGWRSDRALICCDRVSPTTIIRAWKSAAARTHWYEKARDAPTASRLDHAALASTALIDSTRRPFVSHRLRNKDRKKRVRSGRCRAVKQGCTGTIVTVCSALDWTDQRNTDQHWLQTRLFQATGLA